MNLIENPATLVVPPNVLMHMTAVQYAHIFPSGNVRITYYDGSSESAYLTLPQLTEARADFLRLVSIVQSLRGPTTRD